MHNRISYLIKTLGLKKTEFAKALKISSPFVSELCSGAKAPSDRTISDICDKFGVSESWLRTGEGEMLVDCPEKDRVAKLFGRVMENKEPEKEKWINAIVEASDEDLRIMADVIKKFAANLEK